VSQDAFVDVTWVDLLGRPRATRIPSARIDDPITVSRAAVLTGYDVSPDVRGTLLIVPDLTSFRETPWAGAPSVVMADLRESNGDQSPLCSRSVLRSVLERAREDGFQIQAASEFEFFLLDPITGDPVYPDIENYSITRGTDLEPVVRRIRNELRHMAIPVEASNPEYSGGQVEVNITYGPALEAADRATLLRALVRRLARSEGLEATFMAKPWTDQAGSGMHVHQSLWRAGENVFHDSGRLSTAGRHYVAGLLAHMAELALFGCPTPNSYHRRTDLSFAPTVICWGRDNRTLSVRAIEGTPSSTRVEQRDASADCNVYLTFAGQFSAGLDGLHRAVEPPPAVEGNAYGRTDLPLVPRTFLEALECMRDGSARDLLGNETIEAYLAVLEPELTVWLTSSSDWERERYLRSM
jgi:glutamine synthetase